MSGKAVSERAFPHNLAPWQISEFNRIRAFA